MNQETQNKIAVISLILLAINTLTLLSFIPTMSKAGAIVQEMDKSIQESKKFFGN